MRLTDFVVANLEPILAEWEAFARQIWPGGGELPDAEELRDHAESILVATVADMRSDQSLAQQAAKSQGHGHDTTAGRGLDAASDDHGAGRVGSGFHLAEVVAEYRALRASVLRLWRESEPPLHPEDLDDITRFNESMDQSLARAVESFTTRVDHARRMFLAILGHDLRNPLAAIRNTAELVRRVDDDKVRAHAERIVGSAGAMREMIDDLLDFTTAGLGHGLPISPADTDLDVVCRAVVAEAVAAHPDRSVAYDCEGDTLGRWDPLRLRQLVANLLVNAIQHGGDVRDGEEPSVRVSVQGLADEVVLHVHNWGRPIPPEALSYLFDPLRRAPEPETSEDGPSTATAGASGPTGPGNLGLGLFIARQVVVAHGGRITVASTRAAGTTFTVHLPRLPA